MLRCVVIDTLTNAISHGDGDVRLEYWVTPYAPVDAAQRASDDVSRVTGATATSWWCAGSARVHVRVTNRVRADRPRLTSMRVAQLTQGGIDDPTRDEHSTGVGLGSSTYSLRALGGDVVLTQDGDIVSCLLTLPAREVDCVLPTPDDAAAMPRGISDAPTAGVSHDASLAVGTPTSGAPSTTWALMAFEQPSPRTPVGASCMTDLRDGRSQLLENEAPRLPGPLAPTAPSTAPPGLSPTTHITTLDDSPMITRM
jgi:hypothetical protein